MKVKCLVDDCNVLTFEKIYQVINEEPDGVMVTGDDNEPCLIFDGEFDLVEENN